MMNFFFKRRPVFPGKCRIFPGKRRIFPDGRRVFLGGWAVCHSGRVVFAGKVYNRRGVPARKLAGEKGIRDATAASPSFFAFCALAVNPFLIGDTGH
jgi:hypothetical protein